MGRAIVRAYAAEGARVTLTYVSDEEAASSIVKEVESGGGSAAAVPMDLTDHSFIERAVSEAAPRHGGLDVLVANAVRWPTDAAGPLAEADPVVWEKALRANLEGTAATVRAAWPLLAQSGHGRIVLISTGVTRQGRAGAIAYVAKAGLEGLMAALLDFRGYAARSSQARRMALISSRVGWPGRHGLNRAAIRTRRSLGVPA
jgi:NAD(P)-dependent dehydrogenase (short-subunit alcohol dehydrogenase family)